MANTGDIQNMSWRPTFFTTSHKRGITNPVYQVDYIDEISDDIVAEGADGVTRKVMEESSPGTKGDIISEGKDETISKEKGGIISKGKSKIVSKGKDELIFEGKRDTRSEEMTDLVYTGIVYVGDKDTGDMTFKETEDTVSKAMSDVISDGTGNTIAERTAATRSMCEEADSAISEDEYHAISKTEDQENDIESCVIDITDEERTFQDMQNNNTTSESGVIHKAYHGQNGATKCHFEAVSKRRVTTDKDRKWISHVASRFRNTTDNTGSIDVDTFAHTLGLKRDFFCERVFQLFDRKGVGTISVTNLMNELESLTTYTKEQALRFLFNIYDYNGEGALTRDGIQHVLEACIKESSLSLTHDQVEDLTDVLFNQADTNGAGTVTFEGFRRQLERHQDIRDNLSISVIQWLRQKDAPRKPMTWPRYLTILYIRNHVKKVLYILLYIAANIALFFVTMREFRQYNIYMQLARSSGQCLNFNCMWILVLMLRKSMTFLRSTKLRHFLPLDQHIFFHKLTGYTVGFFALTHTLAHIANAAVQAGESEDMTTAEILFTTKARMGHGILTGSSYYTGWLLLLVLVPMILLSLPFIRRTGHFEIFYLVHLLYIPFWCLLLLHGSSFWKWFLVPGCIFLLEKIVRSKLVKKARYGEMWIEELNLLPSKVTHLVINRPVNFHYKPGDYIFIQIPHIAKYEWHPFTISSAPEMSDKIWLHVRSVGNWTNRLYEYFDELKCSSSLHNAYYVGDSSKNKSTFSTTFSRRSSKQYRANCPKPRVKNKLVNVKCFIDGPYGTCAREITKSEHAVLIGAGIGVTPMASILQSIWFKFNEAKIKCPSCHHVWYNEKEAGEMRLKKVDFIWVNRDQKNFEWFLTLLSELEIEQGSYPGPLTNAIETHLYMTSAKKRTDLKGIGLQMALDVLHEKNEADLITGLRAKTKPGRPDWNEVFQKIHGEKKGRVHVYFCGPVALGKSIKDIAFKYDFEFSRETF